MGSGEKGDTDDGEVPVPTQSIQRGSRPRRNVHAREPAGANVSNHSERYCDERDAVVGGEKKQRYGGR